MSVPKMRHCFNCGEELGVYADYDPLDTCCAIECNREARNAIEDARQDAHDRVDNDFNGW